MTTRENLQNEQSSYSFSRDKQMSHYEFVRQKTLWLLTWKPNYNAEKCASDVKKMKNRRKQNFEGEAKNMQLDKEDTRRSN